MARVILILAACIGMPCTFAHRAVKSHLKPMDSLQDGVPAHIPPDSVHHAASDPPTPHKIFANAVQSLINITQWSPITWAWSPLGSMHSLPQKGQLRTSTQYQQIRPHERHRESDRWHMLMAIGGGTGASIGGNRTSILDRDLLRRMHYQDKAVMLLVLAVYMVALWFSATLTFRAAANNSPVTYYADPRFHDLVMEGNDLDMFLSTFNQPPKNIALQVTAYEPVPEEFHDSIHWRGDDYHVAFSFSLDLSPWVQRTSQTIVSGSQQQVRSLQDGVLPEHRSLIHNLLVHNSNDLAFVELVKEVDWPGWEELATNIKHQIRQRGFNGIITVNRVEKDDMHVFKNKTWANFMHARATRVLCALSIVGWMVYVPYMWLRCTKVVAQSHYRVEVNMNEYWQLIADKLTADGFRESMPTVLDPVPVAANA